MRREPITGKPEVILGQKSASGDRQLISYKPVSGPRDEALKGARLYYFRIVDKPALRDQVLLQLTSTCGDITIVCRVGTNSFP